MTGVENSVVERHEPTQYSVVWLLTIVHALGLAIGYAIYSLKFGTNDDSAMAMIWQGAVNAVPPDQPRLIFISTYIGEVLNLALKEFPEFDSYSAFQQLCVLVSSLAVCWTWFCYRRDITAALIGLAFVVIYSSYFFYNIQFTQTSFILVAAGFCLLFHGALSARIPLLIWLIAFGFLVFGGMVRHANLNLIVLISAFLIPMLIISYWIGNDFRQSNKTELALRIALVAVVAGGAYVTLAHLKTQENESYYVKNGWKGFYETQRLRSNIQHNLPGGYDRETLHEIAAANTDFSVNDIKLLRSWMIVDQDLETKQSLKEVSDVFALLHGKLPKLLDKLKSDKIKPWLERNHEVILGIFIIPLAAFFLAIGAFFIGEYRRGFAMIASSVAWSAFYVLIVLTLILYFRYPPARVYVPLSALIFVLSSVNAFYFAGTSWTSTSMIRHWYSEIKRYSEFFAKRVQDFVVWLDLPWSRNRPALWSILATVGVTFSLSLLVPPNRHGVSVLLLGLFAWLIIKACRSEIVVKDVRGFVVKKVQNIVVWLDLPWSRNRPVLWSIMATVGITYSLSLLVLTNRPGVPVLLLGLFIWLIVEAYRDYCENPVQWTSRSTVWFKETLQKTKRDYLESNPREVSFAVFIVTCISLSTVLPWAYSARNNWSAKFEKTLCQKSDHFLDEVKESGNSLLLVMPGAVHSPCYVKPYAINYPKILTDKAVILGWMGYTPWLRSRLFANQTNIPDLLCKEYNVALYGSRTDGVMLNKFIAERGGMPEGKLIERTRVSFPDSYLERFICIDKIDKIGPG